MPERPLLPNTAFHDAVYVHVGLELRLYEVADDESRSRPPRLKPPRIYKRRPRVLLRNISLAVRYWVKPSTWCCSLSIMDVKYHSCLEYLERLASRSDELERVSADQLVRLLHMSYEDQVRCISVRWW